MTAATALGVERDVVITRKDHDGINVEWFKLELLRVAYAIRGGFLSHRDPRAVLAWYAIVAIAPWFTYSRTTLVALFVLACLAAAAARIGPLLLAIFLLGLAGNGVYALVLAWLLSGEWDAISQLLLVSLKFGTVSLVTMAAFVSLDPEKASDGLLALRAPAFLGFAVNYGYRMMPVLIDEFHTIVDGHRVRRAPLASRGFLGWRWLDRTARIAVTSFYPLLLNTAKRTRTTVEMLDTRGFGYLATSDEARRIRLAHLRWRWSDSVLLLATTAIVAGTFALGALWPVLG